MSYDKDMQNKAAAHFKEMAMAVLREGAQLSFRAGGKSMSPFIRDNETVIIEPLARTPRIGDVILFDCQGQQLILHRIIKIIKDGYVTRGDATCHNDRTVPHYAVLGRAVHIIGGLNFHLRFPLSTLVALALGLRKRPRLFTMLSMPGRLLLRRWRLRDCSRKSITLLTHIDIGHDPCDNNA